MQTCLRPSWRTLAFAALVALIPFCAGASDTPSLRISAADAAVTLGWSNNASFPFYLQFATNLDEPTSWNNSQNPSLSGSTATFLEAPTNFTCFYRLVPWEILFNGQIVDFVGSGLTYFPSSSWTIAADQLRNIPGAPGITLLTSGTYTNFELTLDWAPTANNANSGIFYFLNQSAPFAEFQLVHNPGYPAYTTAQYCGGLYNVIAPTNATLRPLNQFNTVKLRVNNGTVEHWLNDTKVVSYRLDSPLIVTNFGILTNGQIGLQFHGGTYSYRNIFIRKLPSP